MIVLAVDTSKLVKARGWAYWDTTRLVDSGTGRPPRGLSVDWVVGEYPWYGNAGAKLKGKALITFCVNNGFQLRDACDVVHFGYSQIPVNIWKKACFPGREKAPKKVFTNLLRRQFGCQNSDELDAIGIGWAAIKLGQAALQKWRMI